MEDRRAALTGLTRKYGATVDDVLAWAEDASGRLLTLDADDEQVAALTDERDRQRVELGQPRTCLLGAGVVRRRRLVGEQVVVPRHAHVRGEDRVTCGRAVDDAGREFEHLAHAGAFFREGVRAGRGVWTPEGPDGPGVTIDALGVTEGPLQVPAPLVRVPEGTVIDATIVNTLDVPLTVHGWCTRGAAA